MEIVKIQVTYTSNKNNNYKIHAMLKNKNTNEDRNIGQSST
jgi:hypothetical protein